MSESDNIKKQIISKKLESQKSEISRENGISKKMKKKNKKKNSEIKNFRTQSMSVSDNGNVR